MTIQKQLTTLKENWLVLLIAIIVLLTLTSFVGHIGVIGTSYSSGFANEMYDEGYARGMPNTMAEDAAVGMPYPGGSGSDIAPDVEERSIVSYASLTTEVERGDFDTAQAAVKGFVSDADAFILNENTNVYENRNSEYQQAYYSIRVPSNSLNALMDNLKSLGEVERVSMSADDITGNLVDLADELAAEQARLIRYQNILNDADSAEEQLMITDRIYYQERRIAYLQERLNNQEERVTYATITFNLVEEQSEFAGIVLTGIGDLFRSFVSSINSVLHLIFRLVPYVLVGWLIWWGVKKYKKSAKTGKKKRSGSKK